MGVATPLSFNWADTVEVKGLALTVRSEQFDKEKLLVRSILNISSPGRNLQLREILHNFWEARQREIEEEQRVCRNGKRERKLRNLHSTVNYDHTLSVAR